MATEALERRPATWEEYLALGEDVRAEYIDGQIVMSPNPRKPHQDAVDDLKPLLKAVLPPGYRVTREWNWKPEGQGDNFNPDLMVHPESDDPVWFTGTPVLCVEVASTNWRNDYVTKVVKYAQAGLDHYWIVDLANASMDVFVRDGEHLVLDRTVTADKPEDVSFGIASVHVDLAEILT
jgi:Uma2 family endonuclease